MKRILSFSLIAIFFIGTAIAGEINYFNKSWDGIKAKTKAEHKYIFVDCYTEWCGWCKVMNKETMVDPSIVETMNNNFVAAKIDMEHGEGLKLAMKYHISGYPTFMFFNPDGEFVYQSVGYQKAGPFATELKKAMDPASQYKAPGYTKSINIAYPEFYTKAFAENGKRAFPKLQEVTTYLDKQKDLFNEVNWAVISRFDVGEKYSRLFLGSLDKYRKLYGPASVEEKVSGIAYNHLQLAIKKTDIKEFNSALDIVTKYMTNDVPLTKISYRITYFEGIKDWQNCVQATGDYISLKGFEEASLINGVVWDMYENCTDQQLLNKVSPWMQQLIDKDPKYAYMDTYAAVLYKTGRKNEAEDWANKAIAEGKIEKEETKATEELLVKIKAMK